MLHTPSEHGSQELSPQRLIPPVYPGQWRQERMGEFSKRMHDSPPMLQKYPPVLTSHAGTQYMAPEGEDYRTVRTLETRHTGVTAQTPTLESNSLIQILSMSPSLTITRQGSVGTRRRQHRAKCSLDPIERVHGRSKKQFLPLAELSSTSVVHGWCMSYVDESKSWSSLSLWAEGRINEADMLSPGPKPNKPRTVILVDIFRCRV